MLYKKNGDLFMRWLQSNKSVYTASSDIVEIDLDDVFMLKNQVRNTQDKRVRICAHQQSYDSLHEMLIVIQQGSYVRPHKHVNKSESFHIIEGALDIVIFDDFGNILKVISMGDFQSGKCFFYRLACSHFHTIVLKTELVVFHETTNGPFQKEDTIYAPWAPSQDNFCQVDSFLNGLAFQITQHQNGQKG